MLYSPSWEERPYHLQHYSLSPWDGKRWPNFTPKEFACKASGEFYYWPNFFDRLQWARTAAGKPFKINSGHRSYLHNLAVGGSPASQHLTLACDISLEGHDKHELRIILREAGFKGFGYYNSFIHVDLGRSRFWFGAGAKENWL